MTYHKIISIFFLSLKKKNHIDQPYAWKMTAAFPHQQFREAQWPYHQWHHRYNNCERYFYNIQMYIVESTNWKPTVFCFHRFHTFYGDIESLRISWPIRLGWAGLQQVSTEVVFLDIFHFPKSLNLLTMVVGESEVYTAALYAITTSRRSKLCPSDK